MRSLGRGPKIEDQHEELRNRGAERGPELTWTTIKFLPKSREGGRENFFRNPAECSKSASTPSSSHPLLYFLFLLYIPPPPGASPRRKNKPLSPLRDDTER